VEAALVAILDKFLGQMWTFCCCMGGADKLLFRMIASAAVV
jgi:hypothetical protein